MKYKYCYKCGKKTERIFRDNKERDYCPNCKVVLYHNPIPSVAVYASNSKGHLLLVKRAVEPNKGEWCLPGGFIENGESSAETALRELKEETGLDADNPELIGVETHLNGYFGDILLIGYSVNLKNFALQPGDDAAEARFYELSQIPPIAFRAHRKFVRLYQKNKSE